MRSPTRRNRNIGTSKQGHGQDNSLLIAHPDGFLKSFFERLGKHAKEKRVINGQEFLFVIEETRKDSQHACSVEDIAEVISFLPIADFGDLRWIILRQPKRKEEILSPVWGRLIYSFDLDGDFGPAIILEAVDSKRKLKWEKDLSPSAMEELASLREDGHKFVDEKRHFVADIKVENVRRTQLYRTLLHELGHYVQYWKVVEQPGKEELGEDDWEQRWDSFRKIPKQEREKFAHTYADRMRKALMEKGLIPS